MTPSRTGARVLVLFAHPARDRSRVNVRLALAVRSLPGVTFHDLYEAYPDFEIDVAREQALLLAHDVIVLQHPFYWYSTPALVKEWEDRVLEHGWAYGRGGDKLHGKCLVSALTAGGSEESYSGAGHNGLTIRALLAPIEQSARLCGIDVLAPFVVHGTHRLTDAAIDAHAQDYRRVVEALVRGSLDRDRARTLPRLNADLASVLGE